MDVVERNGADLPKLSAYEQQRAKNIQRNNSRLRALGLISAAEERISNAAAWGKLTAIIAKDKSSDDGKRGVDDEDDEWVDPRHPAEGGGVQRGIVASARGGKRKKSAGCEGSRKSRRLQGISAEGHSLSVTPDVSPEEERKRVWAEREERVKECREARQRAAKAVAEAGAEAAGKENPTATYDHCLMRVKTMTEKGLTNRVRAIERAAGRHCVVKMAIFKSCLQDEGMWELSQLASEALERLKALKPPPE